MKLGIDFGSCNSFTTVMLGPDPFPLVGDDFKGIPTVFYRNLKGEELFGEDAKNASNEEVKPDQAIYNIKGQLRNDPNILDETTCKKFTSNGHSYSGKEIVAKYFKHLIAKAAEYCEKKALFPQISKELESITVTVPVGLGTGHSASSYNRFIFETLKEVTGLDDKQIHIIPEPVAAAMSYVNESNSIKDETILVFDFGGSTLDVSVIKYESKYERYDVVSTAGDINCGGMLFDETLASLVIDKVKSKPVTSEESSRFKTKIERLKIALSDEESWSISYTSNGQNMSTEVNRAEFEETSQPLLDKVIKVVQDSYLAYSKLYKEQLHVDKVVMVGGSSQMPMVKKALVNEFKYLSESEYILYKPYAAISIGAALKCNELINPTIPVATIIANHSYGIECINQTNNVSQISTIIKRGTQFQNLIKKKGDSTYTPHDNNQKSVSLKVYEYNEITDWFEINHARFTGVEYEFDIPEKLWSNNNSKELSFYVRLTLANEIITVEVIDTKSETIIPCKRISG